MGKVYLDQFGREVKEGDLVAHCLPFSALIKNSVLITKIECLCEDSGSLLLLNKEEEIERKKYDATGKYYYGSKYGVFGKEENGTVKFNFVKIEDQIFLDREEEARKNGDEVFQEKFQREKLRRQGNFFRSEQLFLKLSKLPEFIIKKKYSYEKLREMGMIDKHIGSLGFYLKEKEFVGKERIRSMAIAGEL